MKPPIQEVRELPFVTKLAFGAGDVGPAMVTGITNFFIFVFLVNVAGLSPQVFGTLLLISTLWDAITDPIVGTLSDRTRTRWGRRRPYLLFGAVPFAVSFVLLFTVPPLEGGARIAYFLVLLLVHKLLFTVVNVPYTALTPELTNDYDERTSLNSFRFAFSIIASLVAMVAHPFIVGAAPTAAAGYTQSAVVWALAMLLPFFFCFWGTYERPRADVEAPVGFFQGLRITLGNRAFRYVAGVYLLSWVTVATVSAILIPYVTFWLRKPEPGFQASVLLAVQGSALVWLFIWSAVSRRMGKKAVYYQGMVFWIAVSMCLFAVQPVWPGAVVILLAVLAGVGVATAYLVPWAMLPDVIELDELETGARREGVFYGFFVFLQKVAVAFALFLLGQLLGAAGYVQPPTDGGPLPVQPDNALLVIRLLIGPIPAVLLAAGIYLVYRFPITREQHERTLEELARRRALAAEASAGGDATGA